MHSTQHPLYSRVNGIEALCTQLLYLQLSQKCTGEMHLIVHCHAYAMGLHFLCSLWVGSFDATPLCINYYILLQMNNNLLMGYLCHLEAWPCRFLWVYYVRAILPLNPLKWQFAQWTYDKCHDLTPSPLNCQRIAHQFISKNWKVISGKYQMLLFRPYLCVSLVCKQVFSPPKRPIHRATNLLCASVPVGKTIKPKKTRKETVAFSTENIKPDDSMGISLKRAISNRKARTKQMFSYLCRLRITCDGGHIEVDPARNWIKTLPSANKLLYIPYTYVKWWVVLSILLWDTGKTSTFTKTEHETGEIVHKSKNTSRVSHR